jgi:hypothetical protein
MAEFDHDFLVWFAGFFDGEGHIQIRVSGKFSRCPRLNIGQAEGNNGEAICKEIQSHLGGQVRKLNTTLHKDRINRQQVWCWDLCRMYQIKKLLTAMLPYLRVKKKKAVQAIELITEKEKYYHTWLPHEIDFIKQNYLKLEYKELARRLNIDVSKTKSFIRSLGLPYKRRQLA